MRVSPAIRLRRGFTLLEVLVSVSILLAIVAMLSVVFNEITRAWQKGEGRSERRRSARSLSDFIAGELQGALLPVETLAKVPPSNLQLLINPPTSQVPADYRNADAAFWQAPIATETSFGEVAQVGYFVKWMPTDAGQRPVLCRFFVNPSMQDPSGAIVQNPDFKIYDPTDADAWLSDSLLKKVAPADKASGYVGLFAENVVGLWLRFYSLDGTELPKSPPKVFDSRKGYDLNVTYKDASGTQQTKIEQRYLPAVLTVSVAQIESRLAVRLDNVWQSVQDLSRQATDAADFVERLQNAEKSNPGIRPLLSGMRTYTTQIQLTNGR